MFFSAAISAAFAVDSTVEALEIGLEEIPADCYPGARDPLGAGYGAADRKLSRCRRRH